MDCMSLTLEVSKLSSWLNAVACCRESNERRAYGAGRGCGLGGGRAAGDRDARSVQGRARLQIGGRPRGGAHVEHVLHARDAGGVEAQWLVEHRRILPKAERRTCGARRGRAGQQTGGVGVQRAGEARLQVGGRPRGGAHDEHVVHVRDAGGVEAQWLVEHRRTLPRVKRKACSPEAGGGAKQRAGEGTIAGWG
eukprot:scaffold81772_cov49-Phaeocystis_antarctica.AAC.4